MISHSTATNAFFEFEIPAGIKIWTLNGDAERTNSYIRQGGNLIESEVSYSYTDLFAGIPPHGGGSSGWLSRTFYIEGLQSGVKDIKCSYILDDTTMYTESVRISVVDINLISNYNRDDVINGGDFDRHATNEVYHFWINGDNDDGRDIAEGSSDEHYGQPFPDYQNSTVDGRCDVIDFFPVHIDIKSAIDIFGTNCQYVLKHAESDVNFVYSDLTVNNVGNYLTKDEAFYGSDFDSQFNCADTIRITSTGVQLSSEFIEKIEDDEDKGIILIEGCYDTIANLVLEIRNGEQYLTSTSLRLGISDIEEMYRWVNLRHKCDDIENDSTDLIEPDNNKDHRSNGKNIVFVHGYNVNEVSARAWSAEMFKRLYQSGSNAKFTSVDWFGDCTQIPIINKTPDFYENSENAFTTAPHFANVVNLLLDGSENIIMAHSLGNLLVASAIKDYNLDYSKFIMLDAAVATEAFDASISDNSLIVGLEFTNYPSRVWASKWYELFPSTDARNTLTWKGRFSGMANVYNFYSSSEDVLAGADGTIDSLFNAQNAWTNQEMMKGREALSWIPGNREGGWEFNSDYFYLVPHVKYDDYMNIIGTNWVSTPLPPDATTNITDIALMTNSFFYSFDDDDIYGTNGSAVVAETEMHCRLLADGIPALSDAAGGSELRDAVVEDINMSSADFRRGDYPQNWPRDKNLWWHSDVKNVAYSFNSKIFDKIVTEGGLE